MKYEKALVVGGTRAVDRHRAGELDAFEVGEEIFQYSRAAKELWKACSSLARSGWTAPPGATWR